MPSYGFKLLEIQLFNGRGQKPLNFDKPGQLKTGQTAPHYLDLLVEDFAATADKADEQGGSADSSAGPNEKKEEPAASGTSSDNEVVQEAVVIGSDDVVAEDPDSKVPDDEGNKQTRFNRSMQHRLVEPRVAAH